jgi:hypothetical protein
MTELEERLQALEAEAARAGPGAAAHVHSRAGDLCLGQGDRERALVYYGRAIDASLHARRYNAAAGLCRKLLRVAPGTVRTRCTLAWLALGRGDVEETRREVDAYIQAAGPGRRAIVAAHLARMGRITPAPAIRDLIAARLTALGEAGLAEALRAELAPEAPAPVLSAERQEQLWRDVVAAAVLGPQDLDSVRP